MTKEQKSIMLDEEIVNKVKKDAEEENRSESFVINEVLKRYYEKK